MKLRGFHFLQQIVKASRNPFRARHIWIAKTEIQNLILAYFCLSFVSVLKQFPYYGAVLSHFYHLFVQHIFSPLFYNGFIVTHFYHACQPLKSQKQKIFRKF